MVGTLSGLLPCVNRRLSARIVHRVWTTMWTGCAPRRGFRCGTSPGSTCGWFLVLSRVETSRRGGLGRPILGVVWAPMAPRVEVRRSARRRRTVTAFRERDTIVVLIPQRMSRADERVFVDDMVQRVLAREARARGRAVRRRAAGPGPAAGGRRYLADAEGRAPEPTQRPLGDQPAAALGVVYAEHRRDPAVRSTPADAGLGGRLRAGARAGPPGRADPLAHGSGGWSAAIPHAERARGYLEGYLAGAPDGPPSAAWTRMHGSTRCSTELTGVASRWCSRPTVPRRPRRREPSRLPSPRLPGRRVRGARRPDRGAVRDRRSGLDRRPALAGCPAAARARPASASLPPALTE